MATILVVDDEFAIVQVIAEILREEGHEVLTAVNGRQALQRLVEIPVDMVLTDYMMPSLDGLGLIQEMRDNPAFRDLPVVLMSSLRPEAVETGTQSWTFLRKPFRVHTVLDTISNALSPHSKRN